MNEILKPDICVIGAGAGGLSVAAGASLMGANVVLIEKAKMGGDCLNYGCIPSKTLLTAAKHTQHRNKAAQYGIAYDDPVIDFQSVHKRVQDVIRAIQPADSVERYESFGVKVIQAPANFTSPQEVTAGSYIIRPKRFVISTGTKAFIPNIPGLADVEYLTNETIFDLTEAPRHLIILGAGPIGVELAQAHKRLGTSVTLIGRSGLLTREDPELADVISRRLEREGIRLIPKATVVNVGTDSDGDIIVTAEDHGGHAQHLKGSHLLIAMGRTPQTMGLDLEKAGIAYSAKGIEVDDRLRTSNKKAYAVGDIVGHRLFTHVAGYHAGIVIRNILFKLPSKISYQAIPAVTYSDPELASVGLSEAQARAQYGRNIRILRWPYSENDRAATEGLTDGLIKVITNKKGVILGAGIAGAQAGELLAPWTLAINQKLKIGAMAGVVAPYPTLGEISKRAAGSFYTPKLFGPGTRKMVQFIQKFLG